MALSALLGQTRAATLLGGALASGRPHHAYLFAGPPGVGKTLAAELFARALNCESEAAKAAAKHGAFVDDPCGVCSSCKRISENFKHHTHPLVMWIDTEAAMEAQGLFAPEGDRTASKAIGVRIMRELVIPRLALVAVGGRRKVAILRDVNITDQAQNAFLKTLEEPPPDTSFVILSSTPELLKPTIRSRCMRVPFSPLPADVVAARVARERKMDPQTAALCAAVSGGNLGRALDVDAKWLQKRRDLIILVERMPADEWVGWLSIAESVGEKGDAMEALDILEGWFQDVALAATADRPPSINIDLADEAFTAARKVGVIQALRRIELLRRARTTIEENGAPKLALERFLLEMNGITSLSLSPEGA